MDRQQEILAALQALYSGDGIGVRRLLVHGICESRTFAWRTGGKKGPRHRKVDSNVQADTALAKGISPQDLVHDAIDLTLRGKRSWNKVKYPNIVNHLKWVIKSLVQNLASSGDNKTLRPMPEDEDGQLRDEQIPWEEATGSGANDNIGNSSGGLTPDGPPPEAGILRELMGPNASYFVDEIYKAVSDDDQLAEVLLHLAEGKKPRHIMETMNLSDQDVYRLTQKLRRRIGPILGDES